MAYFRPRRELDWQLDGKCYGTDDVKRWDVSSLNSLFPDGEAAALCRGCTVWDECEADALRSFSASEYAGFPGEFESELRTTGVVRAGRIW